MKRIISSLIWLPIALVFIGFAIANRSVVAVSFDPLNQAEPWFSLPIPVWALVYAGLFVGVIIGWIYAWVLQGKWRKEARLNRHHLEQAKREVAQMKTATKNTALVPADAGSS